MMNQKKQDLFSPKNTKLKKNRDRRISLSTIFSSAFFGILSIFMVVIIMMIVRFVDFQSILLQLTAEALPEVTLSGETYSKVNELTYLTEKLASSPTQAFRRIAYQDVENKLLQISDLGLQLNKDEYLKTQLKAISKEFDGLNLLIEQRIDFQILVKTLERKMYQLHDEVLQLSTSKSGLIINKPETFSLVLNFSEMVALSGKALAMSRLNQVRQLSKQIAQRMNMLLKESKGIGFSNGTNTKTLTKKLKKILVEEDGLLPIRVQELRSIGRATGRGNFVRNLVADYARQVQFHSHQLNEALIKETESTAIQNNEQTNFIILTSTFAILFLIAVSYFVRIKIIKRLVTLNHNVLLRLKGEDLNLNLNGNDEISDIAQSIHYFAEEIEQQKQKLHSLSLTDGLTGIANRRYLDERLESELESAKRHKWPLSILVLDVDSFKDFNDHYGHLAGDDSLKSVAETLQQFKQRKSDFVARFGGEEFVFILPDTTTEGAEQVAEIILKAITALKITHEWNPAGPYLTLSIGISTFNHQQPVDEEVLFERADKALYEAKGKGKNCYVSFVGSED